MYGIPMNKQDWRPSFKYLSKWYVYFDPFRKKSQEGP